MKDLPKEIIYKILKYFDKGHNIIIFAYISKKYYEIVNKYYYKYKFNKKSIIEKKYICNFEYKHLYRCYICKTIPMCYTPNKCCGIMLCSSCKICPLCTNFCMICRNITNHEIIEFGEYRYCISHIRVTICNEKFLYNDLYTYNKCMKCKKYKCIDRNCLKCYIDLETELCKTCNIENTYKNCLDIINDCIDNVPFYNGIDNMLFCRSIINDLIDNTVYETCLIEYNKIICYTCGQYIKNKRCNKCGNNVCKECENKHLCYVRDINNICPSCKYISMYELYYRCYICYINVCKFCIIKCTKHNRILCITCYKKRNNRCPYFNNI